MKRICHVCIGLGIILSLIVFIENNDKYLFINFLIPYVVAIVGLSNCIKKDFMLPLTSILIWATIYNIVYFPLKHMEIIDLYAVSWRILLQLFFPLIIGFILQNIRDMFIVKR